MSAEMKIFSQSVFRLPSLQSSILGYSSLAELQKNLKKVSTSCLVFDFSSSSFIDANLFAVIGAIIPRHLHISFKFSKFDDFKPGGGLRGVAKRNGFLNHYGENYSHSCSDTTIQYRIVPQEEIVEFAQYIHNDALKSGEFPQMSIGARKKIIVSIMEIFANSISHGGVPEVYVCGQFFPKKGELKITLVDLGRTIKRNVSNFFKQKNISENNISAVQAIQWATSGNNTTRCGHTPGGLGLKLLRDFLKKNKGSIQIVSYDGFWEESQEGEKVATLGVPFEGTIVTIVFNTNDSHNYILKGEA